MKYLRLINDKSNRLMFKKMELKKKMFFLFNKYIYSFLYLFWKEKESFFSSKLSIRNFCILSGRPRGVYNFFKISRILLRKFGANGFLSGLKKKS